ncbi:hypothetical protein KSB_21110 [Ktedonobacter robiniae]|uniref:Uncharacterized protein n=1 Tax=Ktedonobacter robiniae TaxID=2778365 RepID=A0ABQ3ULM1_9CHLR|nr:hypothetical protein KSB_21110 [Ktedonobacter robiniae]
MFTQIVEALGAEAADGLDSLREAVRLVLEHNAVPYAQVCYLVANFDDFAHDLVPGIVLLMTGQGRQRDAQITVGTHEMQIATTDTSESVADAYPGGSGEGRARQVFNTERSIRREVRAAREAAQHSCEKNAFRVEIKR